MCECIIGIRLVNGPTDFSGRIEVYYNGEWGTVCDDGFGFADAQVACRELGFDAPISYDDNSGGAGSGRIWLDDLGCSGSESSLGQCSHSGWGIHNCAHGEDVSITCEEEPPMCPEVMCRMHCEFGYVQDENGCDMCECIETPEGPCADKACGEDCTPECPPGLMCPSVMQYCQPDGTCGMNSKPECHTEEPRFCCRAYTLDCVACTYGLAPEDFCEGYPEHDLCAVPELPCSGMAGDHACVCESGVKVSRPVMEIATEEPFLVYGRRRQAIRGQEMYCGMENSCIHEQEMPTFLAGPIDMFHDCLHMETWETYDVSTYFPMNGEEMAEGSSLAYCSDYTFHCVDEIEVELPKCECEGWQSGSVTGDEMCAFQGGVNCALKYLNSEWDEGCPDNAFHCVLEIPEEPPVCPEVMCMMHCEFGYVQDENGCDMCECIEEPPMCPEVMCMMYCESGYVQDEYGCDTCECLEECVDNADFANARGQTCEVIGQKFANKGKECTTDQLLENCCATCASLVAEPEEPERMCEDGEENNDNPCEPATCFDGMWMSYHIDCPELWVDCQVDWVPPAEDECCSSCPCWDTMCTAEVCLDGSAAPIPDGECCGDVSLCPKIETCPDYDYMPELGSDCSMYKDGLSCEYGSECCCDECHANFVSSCMDGMWSGYNTDACMNPECPPRSEGETCGFDAIQYVGECDEGLECVSGYCSVAVSYDEPNPDFMKIIRKQLGRDPTEERFDTAGKKVRDILQERKKQDLEYHPDIFEELKDMKKWWKQGFTENRWNKMVASCMEIDAILNPTTSEPFIARG